MSKLFDASAWVGAWPFGAGRQESLPVLIDNLLANGIAGAAVSPVRAVLAPEPMSWNLALLAELRQADARFALAWVPVINPSLPGWREDLGACVDQGSDRLGGVRLVPSYHGYAVDGEEGIACVAAVAKAGVPVVVQLRMLDERAHHPLMKVPGVETAAVVRLAGAVPEARIVVGGPFMSELPALAAAGNIAVELSMIESGETLPTVLRTLPPERVLLGTHAPLQMPAPAVAKLRGADTTTLAAIGGGTARELLGARGT